MLPGSRLFSILLALLLPVSAAMAQQAPATAPAHPVPANSAPASPDIASPSTANPGAIQLDVVVTPKSGPPVAELRRENFTILDNKIPQPIAAFRAVGGSDVRTEVILLIDAVNTSYQNVAFERGEITKFLRSNGGHLAHPTALAVFTDTGTQIQDGFTQDGNALSQDLNKYSIGLREIRRSAGFYGAGDRFQLSMTALRTLAMREAARPGRKLVLWISPGWPLLSGPGVELDAKQQRQLFASVEELSTVMRQARITLYSIDSLGANENLLRSNYYMEFVKGVSKPSQVEIGDLALQVIATQSGGLALNSTGVASMMHQCIADADNFYELLYTPAVAEQGSNYHSIEVKVNQSGLTARTRTGYYAQAEPAAIK